MGMVVDTCAPDALINSSVQDALEGWGGGVDGVGG